MKRELFRLKGLLFIRTVIQDVISSHPLDETRPSCVPSVVRVHL